MVHFGPSRPCMELNLGRPGSIMVHFGISRQCMEVGLGSIMVHFGFSRRSMGVDVFAQGRLWCTSASQDVLRKSDWLDRGHHYGIDYVGCTPHARASERGQRVSEWVQITYFLITL